MRAEVATVLAQDLAAQAGEKGPVGGSKCGLQAGRVLVGVFGVHGGADLRAKERDVQAVCHVQSGPMGPFGVAVSLRSVWFGQVTGAETARPAGSGWPGPPSPYRAVAGSGHATGWLFRPRSLRPGCANAMRTGSQT